MSHKTFSESALQWLSCRLTNQRLRDKVKIFGARNCQLVCKNNLIIAVSFPEHKPINEKLLNKIAVKISTDQRNDGSGNSSGNSNCSY